MKSELLLLNILPEKIAQRLKYDTSSIAQGYDEVAVLFADIVNFTPLSESMSPAELVELLNKIFTQFDQITEKYGLEKIKTIGDAYMVAGGIPEPTENHTNAIADMALEMQESIKFFAGTDSKPMQIRIGIDTGPVVAGVIGEKKFIYDLWDDTVNTASRMESHGQDGTIQVTQATYEKLKKDYIFESCGLIDVKGKGKLKTYLLKGKSKPNFKE